METALDVLRALARRYAFGEVAALVDPRVVRVVNLCAFGQRLVDLDAEDFAERAEGVPADLVARARECRMPQEPGERRRGALATLVPAYRLLLEVVALRWYRRETSAMVAAIHITSEYLPLLAWQSVLGHAGDPARLPGDVTGRDSLWGDLDDHRCPHTKPERSAARAAVHVADGSGTAWRGYLDRQHSAVAHALATCAAGCRAPCTVMTRRGVAERDLLARHCHTALAYEASPIVRLRHAAPVGHGFGVPSPAEVLAAWGGSRTHLARLEPAVLAEDGYPLPGLPSLFSALAGTPVGPDTLVADTAAALLDALA